MTRHWTFGQKVAAGFAVTVALAIAIGAVSIYALRGVVESKDRVITVNAKNLDDAQKLSASLERKIAAFRGFLLTPEDQYLDRVREARSEFEAVLGKLKRNVTTDESRRILEAIERSEAEHQQAAERVIALRRRSTAALDPVAQAFDEQAAPKRDEIADNIGGFLSLEERLLDQARQASTDTASSAINLTVAIALTVVVFATLVAFVLTRALGRQVGTAVGQVQSSSAELQAAANQQATGAREQATAMGEITTTISELLATSRQIAESAQRVAQIAEQTADAARSGEGIVIRAHESIAGIRRQVDLVVGHMLELGKKSQQIGGVLDIVSELAEQTNILAINATIEAAGAGETGKRFAVVAEEIRKLADRVAGSTKEIRTLIDEVRGAVNTTVMATETGSKVVDAGSRQFADVASAFKQIASQVTTTTEAAREIELSTKQQTTAVEQVNVAIADVAQTTKETEASSGQTLQTASQLATLSRELLRLVQPQQAA
ncbi:MAG: methyl-accepting chemotaxis protein [Acidobacteria bacterium]|nr:methyl-accepting chemotaxis protein [Acidobacteriota bacterium]